MPCTIINGVDGAFLQDRSMIEGPNPAALSRIMNSAALR